MKINKDYLFIAIISLITSQVFADGYPNISFYNPYHGKHNETIIAGSPKKQEIMTASMPKPMPIKKEVIPSIHAVKSDGIDLSEWSDDKLRLKTDDELRKEIESDKKIISWQKPCKGIKGMLGIKCDMSEQEMKEKKKKNDEINDKLHSVLISRIVSDVN